uniref:Uncharacterized protein n=1 Tax=Setaria italica TaxID=4555 RepID=K3Y396_SETIT
SLTDLFCNKQSWLICVHGLHNPGLTCLAVLLIHRRPRSMFLGVSLIAPSYSWRCFISNSPHKQVACFFHFKSVSA